MENEMAMIDAAMDGEGSDFLPDDGVQGILDVLADAGNDAGKFLADGPKPTPTDFPAEVDNSTSESSDATHVTETAEADNKADETEAPTQKPDGEAEPVKKSRVLKLKVYDKVEDLDVNAMSDEELTAELQQSHAYKKLKAKYDALRAKEGQATYRKVYQEQMDNGMTESVAHLVAKDAAGGQSYSLDEDVAVIDDSDDPETFVEATESHPETPAERDFKAEYTKLKVLYPDLTTVPSEVVDTAIANDIDMVASYQAYLGRQQNQTVAAENAALKKENSILKQNEDSALRAPVRGVGGGAGTHQKRDLAIEAFDATW